MTGPTLSARCLATAATSIRSLERELGSPLFVRTTRTVELTDAGRVLLDEARLTLAAAASARESVQAVQGLLRGSLAVGGPTTPGPLDQVSLFARFRDLYPAVDIRYACDTSAALISEVAASRLEGMPGARRTVVRLCRRGTGGVRR